MSEQSGRSSPAGVRNPDQLVQLGLRSSVSGALPRVPP
jgi:hypothetical protein